jgi:hypothetical protein
MTGDKQQQSKKSHHPQPTNSILEAAFESNPHLCLQTNKPSSSQPPKMID